MAEITSIGEAKVAISTVHGSLPEPTNEHVSKAVAEPSAIVTVMDTIEALYAMTEKTDQVRKLIIDLVSFAMPYGWHGIYEENRGVRMILAMRRDLGGEAPEGVTWPDEADDPAPAPKFSPNNAPPAQAMPPVPPAPTP